MPILLACPKCGLRLQIPDELAGRRVACSGCRTVIAAPAAPPPAAVPLPVPVPVSQPSAGPNPFAFGEPEAEPPPRRRPRPREDEDEYEEPRSRPGRGRTTGFAGGCGLAKWGAVVEMIGVAYLFLLVEMAVLEAAGAMKVMKALADLGVFVIVPFFLPILIGTAMMGLGRLRMSNVPRESGAGTVLSASGVITLFRFVLLLAAAVLLAVAWSDRGGGRYAAYAVGAMLGGWVIGTLAEITSVAGLGAVGGAMQNRHLYSTAAGAGLIHQILGLVFVFLFLVSYFAGLAEIIERPRSVPRPGMAGVVWLLVFALQIVFTYSQYSLYAAGEMTGRSSRNAA